MANTSSADWDETSPAITDPRRNGAEEILSLRKAIRQRISKEHVALAGSSVGGEHKAGSAVSYFQTSSPTTRPDGSTALTADDNGRLWVHSTTGVIKAYKHGTGWMNVDIATSATIENFFQAAAYPVSLPEEKTGLTNGTWIVLVYGTTQETDGGASYSVSVTVNTVTHTITIDNHPDGTAPFFIPFVVTVGANKVSITAASGITRLSGFLGFRVA